MSEFAGAVKVLMALIGWQVGEHFADQISPGVMALILSLVAVVIVAILVAYIWARMSPSYSEEPRERKGPLSGKGRKIPQTFERRKGE